MIISLWALGGLFARDAAPLRRLPARHPQAPITVVPNLDDDDGNGLPDHADPNLDPSVENDLAEIRVESPTALPEGTMLDIRVAEPWKRFVRIFKRGPGGAAFRPVQGSLELSPEEAGPQGLKIAVEAGAFAGPGRTRDIQLAYQFKRKDGSAISEGTVAVSVAPFLMSSCLDPVDSVHVVRTKLTETFVSDLGPLVEAAGGRLLAFADPAIPEHDIWFQDTTEIGYATNGAGVMHVALHGNRGRELDALFAKAFLGKDRGVYRAGSYRGDAAEWIDWFGNLEVSPPLEAGDRVYPKGRIYAGTQGVRAMHPEVVGFLEAQGAQALVLWLDTSWLVIGHVDETVSWVPSKVGRPYRMLLPSPRLALEILRRAEQDAPGGILNRGTKRTDSRPGDFVDKPVAAALSSASLIKAQEFVQRKIDGVRRTLQAELGISDADIVEIPVLFGTMPGRFMGRYDALTPNMVNSLQVGDTLIVPDPHGPLVNGTDVLLQAVKDRLEPLGCKVAAVDDFYPYHRYGGETHCGTNATRRPPAASNTGSSSVER